MLHGRPSWKACLVVGLTLTVATCDVATSAAIQRLVRTAASAPRSTSPASLYWKNRDRLPGKLVGATDKHLVWKSPLFSAPFRVDLKQLQAVRIFSRGGRIPPKDPFRFSMRNNDVLYGRLVQITPTEIVVDSHRHGRCHLTRSQVLSFHKAQARNALPPTRRLSNGNSRVYKLDGSFINGQIVGYNEAGELLLSNSRAKNVRIDARQVASVYLSGDGRRVQLDRKFQISFQDGTYLRGNLKSIDKGMVTLTTNWSAQPIVSKLAEVAGLRFYSKVTPTAVADDTLLFDLGKLHGKLSTTSNGKLAWQAVGSDQPVPLSPTANARIERNVDLATAPPISRELSDVIYLTSGDVLPCRIVAIDEETVHVKTQLSKLAQIPRPQVKAVGFSTDAGLEDGGGGLGGWIVSETDADVIELAGRQVTWRGRGTVSRGGIFPCDEIQFNVTWNASQPLVMTVSMGTQDTQRRTGAPMLLAYFVGSDMLVRGLQGRLQHAVLQRNRANGSEAKVRITFQDNNLQVFVDGARRLSQPLKQNRVASRSIVITMQPAGARKRAGAVQAKAAQPELMTLSNFRVVRTGGPFRALQVDQKIKELLLTVPRFQSESPPSHLLVARNGDLLRGRLIDVTANRVQFASRVRDFVFPRDRLTGVIWLDQIASEQSPQPPVAPRTGGVRAVLTSGAAVSLASARFEDDKLIGSSTLLGDYSIPLASVRALEVGTWQALDQSSVESSWQLQAAKKPEFVAFGGIDPDDPTALDVGRHSPLVGMEVDQLQGWLIDGKQFSLDQYAGKVVVLEFWASWCGPCVRSLPETIEAVGTFPKDKVELLAINQQEPADVVRAFIAARGWKDLTVAFDREGQIARQFEVSAIPQLVILGTDRKVKRVFVGASPNLGEQIKTAITELLEGPAAEAGS